MEKIIKLPKRYYIYIPENLNIDELLSIHPLKEFPNKPKKYKNYRDALLYIVHLISAIPSYKKNFDFNAEYGFTPINKQILSKKINRYKNYIDYLVKNNIVIEGTSYIPGLKSKGLKFTNEFNKPLKSTYITTPTLIKSIIKNSANSLDNQVDTTLTFLKKWYNPFLTIDDDKALQILEYEKNILPKKYLYKNCNIRYEDLAQLSYNAKSVNVYKIKNSDYINTPIMDTTGGRIYTPIVTLKKELRKTVKYNNQTIVNIDIKNCQPLLSIILLDINLFEKLDIAKLIGIFNPIYKNTIDKTYTLNNESNSYNVSAKNINTENLKNLIRIKSEAYDVKEFYNSVISGTYYENFVNILIKKSLVPDEIIEMDEDLKYKELREFAKQTTFKSMFEKEDAHIWNKYVKVFYEIYPNVYEIFQAVKKGNNHSALSCMLQKFESQLILHKVCVNINNKYPEIPIFTIHDSIATTESNKDIVGEFVKNEFYTYLNVEPKLSYELWK